MTRLRSVLNPGDIKSSYNKNNNYNWSPNITSQINRFKHSTNSDM